MEDAKTPSRPKGISFLNIPRSKGLAGMVEATTQTKIMLNRRQIGLIVEANGFGDGRFFIRLAIVKDDAHTDDNTNCPWMWINFKARFNDKDETKAWLYAKWGLLNKTYTIYQFED